MQLTPKFRRLVPMVAIILIAFLASCAASNTQKYGCPNHLQVLPGLTSFIK
ncbi:MAG TPA: hypothetical protein VN721_15190 [Flavipsychrobacter sp.]|nr:hypothetical protein [Flavipsychrobacter sp.]